MHPNSQPVGKMSYVFEIRHRFLYALTARLKGKKTFFFHFISAGWEFGFITLVIGGIEKVLSSVFVVVFYMAHSKTEAIFFFFGWQGIRVHNWGHR